MSKFISTVWVLEAPSYSSNLFVCVLVCRHSQLGRCLFLLYAEKAWFWNGFFGALNVVRFASSAVGAFIFRQYLRTISFRNLLRHSIIWAFFFGMTTIIVVERWNVAAGIPDKVFAVGDTLALAVCAEIALMPIVVVAG